MRRTLYILALIIHLSLSALPDCCDANTLSVSGNGKVSAIPDIVILSITIQQAAKTSRQASTAANRKTNQALAVLARNNIKKADIQTTQLSIYAQYDYPNGTQIIKGQHASQTIEVKLRNISPDGSFIGKIIDDLTLINGIQISGLRFDIENKVSLRREARKNAFIDAYTKAAQLAFLSGQNLSTVLTIDEAQPSDYKPPYYRSDIAIVSGASNMQVQLGNVQMSIDASIAWKLR